MHFRTAEPTDCNAILSIYQAAAAQGQLVHLKSEVTFPLIEQLLFNALEKGLMIVAEHPERPSELVGVVSAIKSVKKVQIHVLTDLTLAVVPAFQQQGVDRSLLLLFLDEVVHTRPDIGKVELIVPESNLALINLCQSLEFMIEGRLEMRRRNPDKSFEADIALGWQNPTFEFDSDIE